jgi:type IV pilus assembly protein PilW
MTRPHPAPSHHGFSIVELLVALAIGSLLIVGAGFVYTQSRASFTVNESTARLQESARYVLSVLERDIQSAGNFGFVNDPSTFAYRTAGGIETNISNMRTNDPAIVGPPAAAHACGANFALDLYLTVQASDDVYGLACAAFGGGHRAGTDVLTVRRVSETNTPVALTRLQVYANRRSLIQYVFNAAAAPGPIDLTRSEVRDLIVNTYYISRNSSLGAGIPGLRMKSLAPGPAVTDVELLPAVEDVQVQFGVDEGADTDGDGTPDDPGGDGLADYVNGLATRYVDPSDPVLNSGQVVSVRIWVRVRAERPEPGVVDNRPYVYGTTNVTFNDNLRRVLMSRTIYLHNTRTIGT